MNRHIIAHGRGTFSCTEIREKAYRLEKNTEKKDKMYDSIFKC